MTANEDTITLTRKHLTTVRNAYLKPLLQKHEAGKPLHFDIIDKSYDSAKLALNGLQTVDANIVNAIEEDFRDMHSEVVSQYIAAAKDDIQNFIKLNIEHKQGESEEQFVSNGLNTLKDKNWKFQWDSCSTNVSSAFGTLEEFATPLLQQKILTGKEAEIEKEEEIVAVVEEENNEEVVPMEEGEEEGEDGEVEEGEEAEEGEDDNGKEDERENEDDMADDEEDGGDKVVKAATEGEEEGEEKEAETEMEEKPSSEAPAKKKPIVKRVFGAARAKMLAEKKLALQKKTTSGAKPQQRGASQQRGTVGGRGKRRGGGGRGAGKNSA